MYFEGFLSFGSALSPFEVVIVLFTTALETVRMALTCTVFALIFDYPKRDDQYSGDEVGCRRPFQVAHKH